MEINGKKKVFAYLHTHWDREWYREFEEFRVRLVEVFDDILYKLKTKEIPSFYFDGQTGALEDYLEIKPQNTNLVKKFIKEKRLFVGPYYCSTDSFLVDSESLIRNLQMGIKYSKNFGCEDFIAYHADTFGHSAHIPQIVKYFDIKNAVFWRGLGELQSEFLFNGLKSTYLIQGYFHDYLSADVSYEKKAAMFKNTLDKIAKYSSENILLPLGADHLAVADNVKTQIVEINKLLQDYEIVITTPFEYLKKVEKNYSKNIKREFRDTKRNFILPGVYSSRIDLKQKNSHLQWEISRIVQPFSAIMQFEKYSKGFQSSIDNIYKELINNHPHDSIYGCSVDNVHAENIARYKQVEQGLNAVKNSVIRDIYSSHEMSVLNLSNFDYSGALKIVSTQKPDQMYNAQLLCKKKGFPITRLYRTNEIPVTEDYTDIYEYLVDLKAIKPFSSKKITERDINKNSTLKITEKSLENEYIKLSVKNGKIELTDKRKDKTLKNFISIIDRADVGDSYNFGALKNDRPLEAKIKGCKIFQKGHIKSTLKIDFEIAIPSFSNDKGRAKSIKKHNISMFVSLENQNDFLEFNLQWQNKSKDHILQIKFNMENPVSLTYSDDLAGYTKRNFDADYDIYKYIPAPRGIELKHNTAPFQKSLWAQGLGIITEGLQEYEVFKNELRLTLLRATGTISNPHNPTRGTPAGPPLPTPDLQLTGERTAGFALTFKDSINELESDTEKFYNSALLLNAELEDKTLFSSCNKNILVSTVKAAPNGDLIIRFVNKSDKKQRLKFSTALKNKGIYYTDAMENITDAYSDSDIEPNSFVTVCLKK